MKRHIYILALLLVCILMFAGCQCQHEWQDANCTDSEICELCGVSQGSPLGHTWKAATCVAPKTCESCGTTEGEVIDHTWVDATCAAPKTCTGCGATEGETLPHTWTDADCENAKTCEVCSATEGAPLGHIWKAATCEEAKACEVCGKTDGEALGHIWVDATCDSAKTCSTCKLTEGNALGHKWVDATTEAPKTCSVCTTTEGTAIKTDPRFKTSACKPLFGSWTCKTVTTAEEMGITDYDGQIVECTSITFKNDGSMVVTTEAEDFAAFRAFMQAFMEQSMYDSFAAEGMSKSEADAVMQLAYGMTVKEYAKNFADDLNESDLYSSENCVYYVSGNEIYGGSNWNDELIPMVFSVKGDKLTMTDTETGETTEFTRA